MHQMLTALPEQKHIRLERRVNKFQDISKSAFSVEQTRLFSSFTYMTNRLLVSPALYSQQQVLILSQAIRLIFSSPRLRQAPFLKQCCLYLFYSPWDIWVSVNRFPSQPDCSQSQTGLPVTLLLRWVSPATELSITSPPLLLFFFLSSQNKQWILPLHPQAVILPLPNMFLHEAFNQGGKLYWRKRPFAVWRDLSMERLTGKLWTRMLSSFPFCCNRKKTEIYKRSNRDVFMRNLKSYIYSTMHMQF